MQQLIDKIHSKLEQLQQALQTTPTPQSVEKPLSEVSHLFAELMNQPEDSLKHHKNDIIALQAKLNITLETAKAGSTQAREKMAHLIQRTKLQQSYGK